MTGASERTLLFGFCFPIIARRKQAQRGVLDLGFRCLRWCLRPQVGPPLRLNGYQALKKRVRHSCSSLCRSSVRILCVSSQVDLSITSFIQLDIASLRRLDACTNQDALAETESQECHLFRDGSYLSMPRAFEATGIRTDGLRNLHSYGLKRLP